MPRRRTALTFSERCRCFFARKWRFPNVHIHQLQSKGFRLGSPAPYLASARRAAGYYLNLDGCRYPRRQAMGKGPSSPLGKRTGDPGESRRRKAASVGQPTEPCLASPQTPLSEPGRRSTPPRRQACACQF